ncbi:hypothetical protein HX89_13830 [Dermacoccus nishinomiyaensis]|uniref:Abortive infection protein-like C-terminal domain-containing protein n=2 Tax=Dermacoccaceae TaxID=145357 RepID=A0A075JKF3_9MICO|nr:hypothetical protein HX89_13830 [Dermacoccus nishinomiyaensis]
MNWGVYLSQEVRFMLLTDLGDDSAPSRSSDWQSCTDTDICLSALEALMHVAKRHDAAAAEFLEEVINSTFIAHRVAFKSVDFEFVPFESDALHKDVVEPTLRLLVTEKHKDAHASFLAALKQIAAGDAGNAITDAGSALQHVLQDLGCSGNALGPLWADAKKKGLVTGHDKNLLDGISAFINWASADRSTTGDAHKNSTASLPDAWLMVHVTGALILRLTDTTPRAATTESELT